MTEAAMQILSRATEDADCLLWTGACSNGHPAHRANGKNTLVRRTLWTELRGPIEPGAVIRCTCGSAKCINPEHMSKTTRAKLAKEMGALGLMSGPVRSAAIARAKRAGPQAKLTDADVRRIRAGSESGVKLAIDLGINERTVSKIRLHQARRDFSSPWAGLGAV